MHISDFMSRHPDDEDSPNEIISIAFMLQELETVKFPDHLLYLKEEVDALPEKEKTIMYHIMKMTSCFSFLMISMTICHCYQNSTVQKVQ